MTKRILSLLLSLALLVSAVPVQAAAQEADPSAQTQPSEGSISEETLPEEVCETEEALPQAQAYALTSGTLEGDIQWKLSFGTLTISGTGAIPDLEDAPWYSQREKITSLVVEEGITAIGSGAFSGCYKLATAELPSTLTAIGKQAFFLCRALTDISIPEGVTTLGESAFYECMALRSATLPSGLTEIPTMAFSHCGLHSIRLPDGLVTCGNGAFEGCTSLTEVVLPDSLTHLGVSAFQGCNRLETVSLPTGCTRLESGTFRDCENLKTVTLPMGLTSIGTYAFSGCRALTDITLPDTLTQLRIGAFEDCVSLKELLLPAGLSTIDTGAFDRCTNLCLMVHAGSPGEAYVLEQGLWHGYYFDNPIIDCGFDAGGLDSDVSWVLRADGCLTISGKGSLRWYNRDAQPWYDYRYLKQDVTITSIVVEEGITGLGHYAFQGCEYVTSLQLPQSLTYLGTNVFEDCVGLTEVVLPDTLTQIGRLNFSGCTGLTSVHLPQQLEEMDYGAFEGCTALTSVTLPDSLTSCEGDIFKDCTALTSVTLPDSLRKIFVGMFSGCTALTNITLPEKMTSLGGSAFEGCTALETLFLPKGLTYFGTSVFYGCKNLTLTLYAYTEAETYAKESRIPYIYAEPPGEPPAPEPVAKGRCGDNATWALSEEGVLTISGTGPTWDFADGVKAWDDYREDIRSVVIDEGITYLGSYAFLFCDNLSQVTLPDSLTAIGKVAFQECPSLTAIELPDSITSLGDFVFYGCFALMDVKLPIGLEVLPEQAFGYCKKLRTLVLPDSLTSIQKEAFVKCEALRTLRLPRGLQTIGENAFSECSQLTLTVYPFTAGEAYARNNSIPYTYAPEDPVCTHSSAVRVPEKAPTATEDGNLEYWYCAACEGFWLDTALTQETDQDAIRVPAVGENEILSEGSCGDSLRWQLTQGGLLTISGTGAMSDYAQGEAPWANHSIRTLVVEEGVTAIGNYAFYSCIDLTSVQLPESLSRIGEWAFYDCRSLEALSLPDSVTFLGECAFSWCRSLTFLRLPQGLTSLPGQLVFGCTALEAVTLPEALTEIAYYAFSYCTSLKEISLPDTLTTLGWAAFQDCTSLEQLMLPKNLTNIGTEVFQNCAKLTLSVYPGSPAHSYAQVQGIPFLLQEEVPDSSLIDQGTCGDDLRWFLGVDGKLTISGTGPMPDYAEDRQPQWAKHIPSITDVVIKEGVTSIGSHAFRDHSRLQNVSFPESLKQIGVYAFYGCSALGAVQFPQGLQTLEQFAFQHCTALTEVVIPGNVTTLRHFVFANCTGLKTAVLSEGITSVDTGVFFECTALESITFPGTLPVYIGGMLSGSDGIRQLTLPEGAVKLEALAFEYCPNLTEVTLPATVEEVHANAFYQCPSLSTVWVQGMDGVFHADAFPHSPNVELVVHPGSAAEVFAQSHGISYRYWEVPPVATGTCGESLTWSLSADGTLTISGTGAMEDYKGLVEPKAPWSDYLYSKAITSVVVEEGVTYIGANAFYGLHQLAELRLPDTLTGIGTYAFFNCVCLNSVELPDSVTDMGTCVFAYCEALRSARLSAALTELPQQTFSNCSALTSISLPQGMTKCGSNAFNNCTALESVTLPEGLTHILSFAFYNCTALKTLTVPQSVTNIGGNAFIGCTALTLEVWPGSAAESHARENTIPYVCLEVPDAPCEHPGLTHMEALLPTATQEGNREYWYCDACEGLWLDEALTQVSTPEDVLLPPTGEEVILPLALIPQIPEAVRTEKNADGSYTLILTREDTAGGKLEFPLLVSAPEELNAKDLKWSTSDSRIASAKTDKAATLQGLVTVKAKTSGECVITATNSKTQDTATLTIQIRDYSPRLASASLTLNTSLSGGVETVLLSSYGNGIEAVSLHEYISKTKSYASEPSQRFSARLEDGRLTLDHTQEVKKGTVKLLLKARCTNGETYEYKLSLKVVNTLPSVTVKQQGKLNLFFTDCETRLNVTAKSASVRDVTLVEGSTASFTAGAFDPETGSLAFRLSEAYLQGQAALDNKLEVLIYFDGYDVPLKKSVALTTEKKAPKLTLSQPSSIVNTALEGNHSTHFDVIGAPQDALITADAAFARAEVTNGRVTLTLTGTAGGTAAVHVSHPDWAEEVVLKHKVTVQSKLPAVKLKTGTLKLNALLGTSACAQTEFVLPKGVSDFAVTDMLCLGEYQGFTLTLEDGILLARLTEPELASNGSLKLYPILTHLPTGQQVTLDKALTLKVQIYSGRPSVTVTASGKLDTIVPGSAITYTIKKLSNISGTPEAVRLEGIGAEQFRVTLEGNTAVLTLDPEVPQLKGKTYKLKLVYRFGDQEAAANISVKVDQSNVKFTAVKPVSLYQANSRLACVLELTAPLGASVQDITLGAKTAPQFVKALGSDALTFLELENGKILVSFKVTNPAHLVSGKSYTVYLDITPKGNAENAQPTSLKLTVKTFK